MNKIYLSTLTLSLSFIIGGNAASKQKNVLFILTDDLQSGSIAAYGNKDVYSPNIDNLISSGTSFTSTYTNGAIGAALSMPSRAMIMTGRGVFEIESDGSRIPDSHTTLGEIFRENGYKTFATGKWHSDYKSFNRSFETGDNIFFGGMHTYESGGHKNPRLSHYDNNCEYKELFVGEKFSSEMYADALLNFIDQRQKDDDPFFAYVAFTSPHDPRIDTPHYGRKYDPSKITLPPNYKEQHSFDNGELDIRDEIYVPTPRTPEIISKELADYYGMISELDFQIGRIIKRLKESGDYENTIIVFASDNGLAMGQHGLVGKQNLYQHSIKVPLVFVGENIQPNKRCDANCYLYDIVPTLCDLLDFKTPESVNGLSFASNIKHLSSGHRKTIFLAYSNIQRSVIKNGWKYIVYNIKGKITEQLFNIKDDPWERENLISAYKHKRDEYRDLLKDQMLANNDFCILEETSGWWGGEKIPWHEGMSLYKF